MPRVRLLPIVLAVGLVSLAGCQSPDPYQRTDVWNPTGANAGNIAAMVANPEDLIHGHGATAVDAHEPALAVGHIWNDQPKALTSSSGSSSSSGSGSGS